MERIARVFPTKTNMSPNDPLAFFGAPTMEAMAAEPEAVHISVTFSWDIPKVDELLQQWETLGVPVFAVGVPTVVDGATLAADLLEEAGIQAIDEKKLRGQSGSLTVTPRDIDAQVRDLSKVIGFAINWALQNLEIEEINALLS